MEILKVQLARSIWLFDSQDLNPRGVALFPGVFQACIVKYQFSQPPKAEDFTNFNGGRASLFFRQGRFEFERSSVGVELEIHSDGLVANSRHSTEASDAFLQDFIYWLGEQLSAKYGPRLTRKRLYRSELILQAQPGLEAISEKLNLFAQTLSSFSGKTVHPSGVIFGAEDMTGVLTIERRLNVPFDENQYYSASTLPTLVHSEAVRLFEKEFCAIC